MDAPLGLTEAALLDALTREVSVAPSDAKTVEELAAKLAVSIQRIRRELQVLHRAGRLQHHFVIRPRIDGRLVPCPAYTVRPAP